MKALRSTAVCCCLLATSMLVQAQSPLRVKLATFVPATSLWGKNLNQMKAEWTRDTGGRVVLTIFPGGSQGDDVRVMQKMRLGALQAAALSTGLSSVDDAFNVFSIPFFFESYDELAYVLDELTPELERRLETKGFILLNWGYGGWAHVFTTEHVTTVEDLKKARIFTAMGDDRMAQLYKANGFEPQALAPTDIPTGLKTGMIEALPTTPLAALSFQWYSDIPFMMDVALAPVLGATVITQRAWRGISEADRAAMLDSAKQLERRLLTAVPEQDGDAVEQMRARALTVVEVDASGPAWQVLASSFAESMRGTMVPPDILDMATRARDAFRASHSASGGQ